MGGIIVFGARADRQDAAGRWGDALAALEPDQRAALTARRPDLADPAPPASPAALAARAMGSASLVLAVRMLAARALQLTEVLAVLGPVTNRAAVIEAAGAELEPGQLDAALAEVAALAVALPGLGGELLTPPGLAALFDGRPGGLGPSVEQLMAGAGVWNKSELAVVAATLSLDPQASSWRTSSGSAVRTQMRRVLAAGVRGGGGRPGPRFKPARGFATAAGALGAWAGLSAIGSGEMAPGRGPGWNAGSSRPLRPCSHTTDRSPRSTCSRRSAGCRRAWSTAGGRAREVPGAPGAGPP